MVKTQFSFIFLIAGLLLALSHATEAREVRQTIESENQAVVIDAGYAREVIITKSPDDKIYLEAQVMFKNRDADLSSDFSWQVEQSEKTRIKADFGEQVNSTILLDGKVDIPDGIPEDASLTGTLLRIALPENTDLEVKSHTADISVEFLGGYLMVSTINDIRLKTPLDSSLELTAQSMLGELDISSRLNPKLLGKASLAKSRHRLVSIGHNGPQVSLITLVGNIILQSAD